MHYNAIILAIYNESLDVYKPMKLRSNDYYNRFSQDIKVFYITFRENQNEEIIEDGEFLYFKGTESFKPGIIMKTIKAMDYINKQYSYDYVVRTNVSTLINIQNMLYYFSTIPKKNYTGGFVLFNWFYSGTFIVVSKDVSESLCSIDWSKENIYEITDDVLITEVMIKHQFPVNDIYKTNYTFEHCDNNNIALHDDIEYNIEKYANVLCYRVRNDADRNVDLKYFDKIIRRLISN